MKAITTPHPIIKRHKEEEYFFNSKTKEKERFPSIDSDPEIDFSVIVPAYDEEKRCECVCSMTKFIEFRNLIFFSYFINQCH